MRNPAGGSNRRRSDRISLSLPVQVRGVGPKDKQLNDPSKTVEVGRTGTKFPLKTDLRPNQRIKIENIRRGTEANFRVVGKGSGPEPKLNYWGAECLDPPTNFWGINFPPPEEGKEAAGRVLLACGTCKAQELSYLSDLETEVFSLTDRVVRECNPCAVWTEWFKPKPGTEAKTPATAAGSEAAGAAASSPAKAKSNRASRRLIPPDGGLLPDTRRARRDRKNGQYLQGGFGRPVTDGVPQGLPAQGRLPL